MAELYDRIGVDYTSHRRPDSRIAEAILRELGDARTVVNVGAGAGAYEPSDRRVFAVEPASTMIGQRPRGAPPAIRAHAEALPFADATFDAAMAVLSDHHWADRATGLRELRRVARRAVVFTWDPSKAAEGSIVRDYLTEFGRRAEVRMSIEEIAGHLGGARILPVPVPHDCSESRIGRSTSPAPIRAPRAALPPWGISLPGASATPEVLCPSLPCPGGLIGVMGRKVSWAQRRGVENGECRRTG